MSRPIHLFRTAPIIVLALLGAACADPGPAFEPEDTMHRQEVEAWKSTGYAPNRAEAVEHRLTDLEPVVADFEGDRQWPFSAVHVATTVGADGRVVSARVVGEPPSYTNEPGSVQAARQALDQVRALRFEPFVRDGVPVIANLEVFVPMVEVRSSPPPSRTFPEGPLAGTRIELKRTQCFGSCPAYTVTISGAGEVTWQGDAYVAIRGEAKDKIDPKVVTALLDRAKAAGFFDLRDVYRADVTDGPTFTITITHGGRIKRVEDYNGELVGMPYEVTLLEQAIDRAARTARWIGPDQLPGKRSPPN